MSFDVETAELPFSLILELELHDPETISELQRYREGGDRERVAAQALRIGILALRQASGQIDRESVRQEGDRVLSRLGMQLEEHARTVQERVTGQLKEYFDPQSGRFSERVQRLIQKDGELEQSLRRVIGSGDSELTRTLASHVGSSSPLMMSLDPQRADGLLTLLRQAMDGALQEQREKILQQFSLDHDESALVRFLAEVGLHQDELTGKMQGQLDQVAQQFSLDDENSALSRLVRNVTQAQRTISAEFSLDSDASALSRLKKLLESTNQAVHSQLSLDDDKSPLARLKRELLTLMKESEESNRKFQEELRVAVETLQVRRQEMLRGTQHGALFEDAVFEFIVRDGQSQGDLVTHTGQEVGLIARSKVGDCVIELGPESAAPGGRIVIEAKQHAGYNMQKAVEEMDVARKNRSAQVGLFVWSRLSAPAGTAALNRIGNDVFVVWDAEDSHCDLILQAGISLARALCVRTRRVSVAQKADFDSIDKAILEVEGRTNKLDEVEKSAQAIAGHSEKILTWVRVSRTTLAKQIDVLREKTDAIKRMTSGDSLE